MMSSIGWSRHETRAAWMRVATGVVLVACVVVVSLLWWRSDADLCTCEYCPDGHCGYAAQIHTLLRATSPEPVARFLSETADFIHAHVVLAPALVALLMFGGLGPVPAFALLNVVATLLSWYGVRRVVERTWAPRPVVLLQLTIAFFANPIVIRSLARPVSDAVGMLCIVWALAALDRHLAARDRRSSTRLLLLQVAGLASRVSFIPMLGMPALAELAEPGAWPDRIRRAARAGLVFGLLPALLFFGVMHLVGLEHVREVWRFAHLGRFVSQTPLADFAASAALAGGAYLVLGLLPLGEGRDARARRLHLSWAILYLAFLAFGRGALWPRYFLPIVPSLLIVATPALLALDRRSPTLVWAAVALCALPGGRALLNVRQPLESLALLAGGATALHESEDPGRKLAVARRRRIAVTASTGAEAAPLMFDGRAATAWSTIGPRTAGTSITLDFGRPRRVTALALVSDHAAAIDGLVVDGSLDGQTWIGVPVTVQRGDFFAEHPRPHLLLPGRAFRSLRITATEASAEPWVIRELDLRFARGPERSGSRRHR